MSKLVRVPLPTGSWFLADSTGESQATDQRLVNCMAHPNPKESGQPFIIKGTPGLSAVASAGSGPIRGMIELASGAVAFVSGGLLCTSAGFTSLGAVDPAGPVTMATGGEQIMVACNGRLFLYNGSGVSDISSSIAFQPGSVSWNSGFWIVTQNVGKQFQISELNSTTFDPLDFATVEGNSNNLVTVLSTHLDTWFFGTNAIEIWYLSGAADFAFQRQQGGYIEIGTIAQRSPTKCDNSVFWLGHDNLVYRADGYTPRKVSDEGVDAWISGRVTSDAIGMSVTMNGHNCYVLCFPSDNFTWVFDCLTEKWFSWSSDSAGVGRNRANAAVLTSQGQSMLVGDNSLGTLYVLSGNVFTDAGNAICRIVQFPALYANTKRAFMGRFMLDMASASGTDTVSLTWASQGTAFSGGPRVMSLANGPKVRMFATRLGSFFRRIMRVTAVITSDFTLIDAWMETDGEDSGGS